MHSWAGITPHTESEAGAPIPGVRPVGSEPLPNMMEGGRQGLRGQHRQGELGAALGVQELVAAASNQED